jgi:homoserine dehydrogenase
MLKDAQHKGYAEADPSADIDGHDAAQKLALLTACAFGVKPDIEAVHLQGIRDVSARDIAYAGSLGYTIKLIGVAQRGSDGGIDQLVEPCLITNAAPLAGVDDATNAVRYDAELLGHLVLSGYGAGGGATASAVLSDLADIASGNARRVFGIPADQLEPGEWQTRRKQKGRFYVRITAMDKPGVLAAIAEKLRDHDISIESVLQRSRDPDRPVNLVIITHECSRGALQDVLHDIEALQDITQCSNTMRIYDT